MGIGHWRARARRASVLILVVALLVLVALVGTAFIVTARTDRGAARQHVHNTQADMALQSAVNLVLADMAGDLFNRSGHSQFRYKKFYRPGVGDGTGFRAPFENADFVGDELVGPRVPVVLNADPNAEVTSLYPTVPDRKLFPFDANGVNPPVWVGLGRYPQAGVVTGVGSGIVPVYRDGLSGLGTYFAPTARPFFGRPLWPCFQMYAGNDGTPLDFDGTTPEPDPMPAADADGDGIADSILWTLPLSPTGNVTYFAAARVVDNNGAVNVNTALARDFDFDGTGASRLEPGFFPGRVGLAELLRTYNPSANSLATLGAEMNRLNAYRMNLAGLKEPAIAGVWDGAAEGLAAKAFFLAPVADDGAVRGDFLFLSVCDALHSQFGRRLGNPGYIAPGKSFRPFSLSDQMALAHQFCIARGDAGPTFLEQLLGESLFLTARGAGGGRPARVPTTPYSPEDVLSWFDRFHYEAEVPGKPDTFRDRRALLLARNPLSNQAPGIMSDTDVNGDGLRNDLPPEAVAAGVPPYAPRPGVVRAPARVSINAAPFGELWRGFWSVIANDVVGVRFPRMQTPSAGSTAAKYLDPFRGAKFNLNVAGVPDFTPLAFGSDGAFHWCMMFRSVLRDVRTTQYDWSKGSAIFYQPESVILLRSALAAVNAEDLRDPDDDVTTHLIKLPMKVGQTKAEQTIVRVCGTERQPYLTEVYVNTDSVTTLKAADGTAIGPNPKGYVAIEFHNPYDEPINLGGAGHNGWSVGVIDRWDPTALAGAPAGAPAKPVLWVRNLDGTPRTASETSPPWRFPAGTVVPPHGFLLLENYDPDAPAELPPTDYRARFRPAYAVNAVLPPTGRVASETCHTVYVPNLHRVLGDKIGGSAVERVLGGEFVLLRTRRADGTSVDNSKDPDNPYNEQANLWDLLPVDQFDFTGMRQYEPDGDNKHARYIAAHYARANDPSASPGGAWKFVYPGRYDGVRRGGFHPTTGKPDPRHQGLVLLTITPGDKSKADEDPASKPTVEVYDPPPALGLPDAKAHAHQGSFPIQLANFGHRHPLAAKGNMYPFGMFAREADLLQVPFIGAYTVFKATTVAALPTRDLYEMNSVSMDSVFAEDSDYRDDYIDGPEPPGATGRELREQIGRFCPVYFPARSGPPKPGDTNINDFAMMPNNPRGGGRPQGWWPSSGDTGPGSAETPIRTSLRYAWANDLFDFFTVEAPDNDFFPDVAPSRYKLPVRTPARAVDVPIGKTRPQPVSNYGGEPGSADPDDATDPATGKPRDDNDFVEQLAPVEGRINVNTAPWRVLACLPMVLKPDGTVDVEANAELAKAIAYFRDIDGSDRPGSPGAHGAFFSISELNKVVDRRPDSMRPLRFRAPPQPLTFSNGYGTLLPTDPAEPALAAGDLSPGKPGATDQVRNDFEERNLVLSRISNLITTRSDSYTCYVYVVGVMNAFTPQAEIKTQRRTAFVADRSTLGPPPQRPVVHTQVFNNE